MRSLNLQESILSTFIFAQLYYREDEELMKRLTKLAQEIDIELFDYKYQLVLRMIRKIIEELGTLPDEVSLEAYFKMSVKKTHKYYDLIYSALLEAETATPLVEVLLMHNIELLTKKRLIEQINTIGGL